MLNFIGKLVDILARHNPLDLVFGDYTIYSAEHLVNLAITSAFLFLAAGLFTLHKRNLVGIPMLIGAFCAGVSVYGYKAGQAAVSEAFVTGNLTGATSSFVTAALIMCVVCGALLVSTTGWLLWRRNNPAQKLLQLTYSVLVMLVVGTLGNGLSSYSNSLFSTAEKLDPRLWAALFMVLCVVATLALWHAAVKMGWIRSKSNNNYSQSAHRKGMQQNAEDDQGSLEIGSGFRLNKRPFLDMTQANQPGQQSSTQIASQGHVTNTSPPQNP